MNPYVLVILWAVAILWCLRDASKYAHRAERAADRAEAAARAMHEEA